MLSKEEALKIESLDVLMDELKEHVKVRNKMSGALYWNILNDECCSIANKCVNLGGDKQVISHILGPGSHY
ncbi:MAG TPA: hypothetical protein VEG39_01670 [Clostridia bacterium]|nr:hypothetical protein [Clostridia bacterium]